MLIKQDEENRTDDRGGNITVTPSETLMDLLSILPRNDVIITNATKAWSKINSPLYKKIICSISGGADSDVMLDICFRCDKDKKIDYVWFDTGLEYQATKDHLKYLENKYGIEIKTYRAIKPIPTTCRDNGQPFVSKQCAEYINRLQSHDFDFTKGYRDFEELYKEYPRCKAALLWWCNLKESNAFNIRQNAWLKEFLINNPPTFKISSKCCKYAKKDVAHKCLKEGDYDLNIIGVRKAEGGVRSTSYKSCFDENGEGYDNYRPLFWYLDSDKEEYVGFMNILHSACYTEYGLKRTGCAGCPFGRDFEKELLIIQKYEPKFYKAVNNIFGDSYEYTRKYRLFCEEMNKKYGSYTTYMKNNIK